MLRWYLGGLLVLMIVIGFGAYHYVMTHPARPGTLAGRVYEKTVKTRLSFFCGETMKRYAGQDEANTEEQLDAACDCFVNEMFEKFRHVPPGDLDALAQEAETQRSAGDLFEKCVYRAGLN